MTSMDPRADDDGQVHAPFSVDPCHPSHGDGAPGTAAAHGAAEHVTIDLESGELPPACELGVPAVLEHRVVALEIGATACPVAIHRWTGERVCTTLMTPAQAQVWARAGRLTLVNTAGQEYRLTVLAPEECASARLGSRWPLNEPEGKAKRIATAAVHDVGDLLTFPAWLARTAHLSGERNHQLARLVNRIREVSPGTTVFYGQTSSPQHASPGQFHPYDHKGLVGREGYPHEL
ncbi:MAG: hypothetical protein ACRDVE_15270 [Actinocrinis sp.]